MSDKVEAVLDGREIEDKEQLHGWLAQRLGLPPWYGGNLDALYDCLTDIHVDTLLIILHPESLQENLGGYADRLFQVLCQAEKDNPRFRLAEAGEDLT